MNTETDNCRISYEDSPEIRAAVFARCLKFFVDNESFNSESIVQNDGPQMDAPNAMSDIAELFGFDIEWKEE